MVWQVPFYLFQQLIFEIICHVIFLSLVITTERKISIMF